MENTTQIIVNFLRRIGLSVQEQTLSTETFLPGIRVDNGVLLFDPQRLKYPGDLLHEAGHLAVLPPTERYIANDFDDDDGGYEMAAIAWSYAACKHLQLPLDVVFHPDGYKAGSAAIIENFSAGRYFGVPILEWRGMTSSTGNAVYPKMQHWLCPQ